MNGMKANLPKKTERETTTGKAQKLLFPCSKSVQKGMGLSENKADRRSYTLTLKGERRQTRGKDGPLRGTVKTGVEDSVPHLVVRFFCVELKMSAWRVPSACLCTANKREKR